jgi:isoleucyl-tRNA synthetase
MSLSCLTQILWTFPRIIAPVLPYLAEEIHEAAHKGTEEEYKSLFETSWTPMVRHLSASFASFVD